MSTNRKMIAATMLAAAAVSSAVATAAPASAATKYIAVSYSQASGQWGRAQAGNLDAAIAGSLSQCGGHCAVASWSKNGCVALAVNQGRQYNGWYGLDPPRCAAGHLREERPRLMDGLVGLREVNAA